MNTRSILALLPLLAFSLQPLSYSRAQGSLTPPAGPPVASMKTLDQVKTGTPLIAGSPGVAVSAAGTITISQPGSYFLTKNLTISTAAAHGVVINASNVTLDLNHFSLICTGVLGGDAVQLSASSSNACIYGGNIAGGTTFAEAVFTPMGWNKGVAGNSSNGVRISDLTVTGIRGDAIGANASSGRVERVTVDICGAFGILGFSVLDCMATHTGASAIVSDGGVVSNSIGESVGETINDSGIAVSGGIGQVSNSRGTSNKGYGLLCHLATNCHGSSTSGIGLTCTNAHNCSGTSFFGAFGMDVLGTASYCRGTRSGGTAIAAGIAVACTSGGGTITGIKQLGTP